MRMLVLVAVSFLPGGVITGGVVGSALTRFHFSDQVGAEELNAGLQELRARTASIEASMQELSRAQRNRPSRQEIQQTVMHSVHGCSVVGYSNADLYTIECPIAHLSRQERGFQGMTCHGFCRQRLDSSKRKPDPMHLLPLAAT